MMRCGLPKQVRRVKRKTMQGMVADLSHQIKTPVANIKMDFGIIIE